MGTKADALTELKKEYADCSKCSELCSNRTNIVFGVGDPDTCKVVIIGEAPGKNEDLQNEPFVGRSGQVLNSLLKDIGLKRSEVYITNTVLCRPPDNRDPTPAELANCRSRLNRHIKLLKPRVVITLGNFSTKYMLDTKAGITNLRGKPVQKDGMTIVPMFHPATLLYSGNNPEKRQQLLDDFIVVQNLIGAESPDPSKGTLNQFM